MLLALFACTPDNTIKNQFAEANRLLLQTKEQEQILNQISIAEIDKLKQRIEILLTFEGFAGNDDVIEVLNSGNAFLSEVPLMTFEINEELTNNTIQLQTLMKEMNQLLYTTEEVTEFLIKENHKLEQLIMKVDYVRDRFNAWQINAETIESAMRNLN